MVKYCISSKNIFNMGILAGHLVGSFARPSLCRHWKDRPNLSSILRSYIEELLSLDILT